MKHHLVLRTSLVVCLLVFLPLSNSGVANSRPEAVTKSKPQTHDLGLYNATDKVIVLTKSNFKASVIEQSHASLIEFYNSYCGHCKRFAPVYKELAESIWPWREVIKIMAIDCAAEENNEICREYEVMAYPTIRYFGRNYRTNSSNYGTPFTTQDTDEIRSLLATLAANETATDEVWPNFSYLTEEEASNLFHGVPTYVKFVVLVLTSTSLENSSAPAAQTILNFNNYPQFYIRRVNDEKLAAQFNLNSTYRLGVVDQNRNIELLPHPENTAKGFTTALENFIKMSRFTQKPDDKVDQNPSAENTLLSEELQREEDRKVNAILLEVKRNKHMVYQADLEQAIRHIIHNEIPKVNDISGERLLALQRFMNVLQRYNPLGPNGITFVNRLQEYVALSNQAIDGKSFQDKVQQLEGELAPIFSSSRYIGCTGSKQNYRGFTCSLWKLFHFLTVQADVSDKSTDPLEVLQAMHGFVKYFFGCTDCSEHFQDMSKRRQIWNTPTKDEAVLWLWEAHNEVNNRLAGDETEDPQFPKQQFPTKESCRLCQKNTTSSDSKPAKIVWDRAAVLSFLKNINNPGYVSRFGLDDPDILHASVEKIRQKRMIGNVFSDMDMRMGMLLYGFCIIMMIVAFKLFAFKGYRKKPYAHDFLGKV